MYVNKNLLLQSVPILNTRYLRFKGENDRIARNLSGVTGRTSS